jgi:hypothetical protein
MLRDAGPSRKETNVTLPREVLQEHPSRADPLRLRPQVGRAGYGTLEYILRLEVRKASKWNRRVAAAMTGLCLGGTAIMVAAAYAKCLPDRRGGEVRTAWELCDLLSTVGQ